jgi:hypothetical protein
MYFGSFLVGMLKGPTLGVLILAYGLVAAVGVYLYMELWYATGTIGKFGGYFIIRSIVNETSIYSLFFILLYLYGLVAIHSLADRIQFEER